MSISRIFKSVFLFIALQLMVQSVWASYPDPTGTWAGTVTENETMCYPPGWVPTSDTFPASINISNFNPTTGEMTITWTDTADNEVFTLNLQGQYINATTIEATYSGVVSTGTDTFADGSVETWTDTDYGTVYVTIINDSTVSININGYFDTSYSITPPLQDLTHTPVPDVITP